MKFSNTSFRSAQFLSLSLEEPEHIDILDAES